MRDAGSRPVVVEAGGSSEPKMVLVFALRKFTAKMMPSIKPPTETAKANQYMILSDRVIGPSVRENPRSERPDDPEAGEQAG